MEDSKEEEENGCILYLGERRTASWRHTNSKEENVTEQPMRNSGRERISKKNALCRIKLMNQSNYGKAAYKRRKLQNSSYEDSESEESWDDDAQEIYTFEFSPEKKEDPKPMQAGRSRRKIPPHLNRITEKSLEVTQKSNQNQDVQIHLVSDDRVSLKLEGDMEFVDNPIKSDIGLDDCFEPLQDQEKEEVMGVEASFQLKAEMDLIKSEVEDSVLTKPTETVKMRVDESEPVYPVALISVSRQSESPDMACFSPSDDHSIELSTIDTNEEILRNEEEADYSEDNSNTFAFVVLDEACEMQESEEMESSCELKPDSVNCQQEEVVSEMPVVDVEKVDQFSDNTCKVVSMEEFNNVSIALPCRVTALNGNAEYEEFMLVPNTQGNRSEPKSEPTLSEQSINKPVIDTFPTIGQLAINNPSLRKHSPSKYVSKVDGNGVRLVRQRRPINILSKRRRHNVQNTKNLQNQDVRLLPGGQRVLLPNEPKNNVAVCLDTFS